MSSGIGSWRFNFARHDPRAARIFVGVGFGPRRPIPPSSKLVKICRAGHFWYGRPHRRFPTGIPVPVHFAKTIADRSPRSSKSTVLAVCLDRVVPLTESLEVRSVIRSASGQRNDVVAFRGGHVASRPLADGVFSEHAGTYTLPRCLAVGPRAAHPWPRRREARVGWAVDRPAPCEAAAARYLTWARC